MKTDGWRALDEIRLTCEQSGTEHWRNELNTRPRTFPRSLPDERGIVGVFAVAIAISRNARTPRQSYSQRRMRLAKR